LRDAPRPNRIETEDEAASMHADPTVQTGRDKYVLVLARRQSIDVRNVDNAFRIWADPRR